MSFRCFFTRRQDSGKPSEERRKENSRIGRERVGKLMRPSYYVDCLSSIFHCTTTAVWAKEDSSGAGPPRKVSVLCTREFVSISQSFLGSTTLPHCTLYARQTLHGRNFESGFHHVALRSLENLVLYVRKIGEFVVKGSCVPRKGDPMI